MDKLIDGRPSSTFDNEHGERSEAVLDDSLPVEIADSCISFFIFITH
jgi:hypothetical protein